MRIPNFIVLAGLLALPGLATFANGAELQNERSAVEECGAHSESAMRECLSKRSQQSKRMLEQTEAQAAARLSMWDEDSKYISRAKEKLRTSSKAFEQYRDAQCAFDSSLGGGAIGNALEMRRLGCLIGLNTRRSEQLNSTVAALPAK